MGIPNINPETNVAYGVIALNSLDSDLAHDLFCDGDDLDFAQAQKELREAIEAACEDHLGLSGIEELADRALEIHADNYSPCEPTIEGVYEGVHYLITYLGGAQILYVTQGPLGAAHSQCSPCVPNAGDLDSGFTLDTEERGDRLDAYECYCVPRDWLRKD